LKSYSALHKSSTHPQGWLVFSQSDLKPAFA
jgi:hypothetical protein